MPAVELPLRYGIVQSDIEDRLSADEVVAAFDDNNDGTADATPILRLLADAISFVEGAAAPHYPLDAMRSADPVPNDLVRMILDAAEWMAVKRHPEVQRGLSWIELRKANRQDIESWAKGERVLDTTRSPEPATNQGGVLLPPVGQNRGPLFSNISGGRGKWGIF